MIFPKEILKKLLIKIFREYNKFSKYQNNNNRDKDCLKDEDYFNRNLIAHGLMEREINKKDAYKTIRILFYLITSKKYKEV